MSCSFNKNTKEIKAKLILTSEKVKDLSSKLLKSLELHLKDKEKWRKTGCFNS